MVSFASMFARDASFWLVRRLVDGPIVDPMMRHWSLTTTVKERSWWICVFMLGGRHVYIFWRYRLFLVPSATRYFQPLTSPERLPAQIEKLLVASRKELRSFHPMTHSPEDVSPDFWVDSPEEKVDSPGPRVDSPGLRVDSPGLIKPWIILTFCWLNLSNIRHLTFPNLWRCQLIVEFNLSRVYCKRTLPMDTSIYHAANRIYVSRET